MIRFEKEIPLELEDDRAYHSFCYDSGRMIFWAVTDQYPDTIFGLSEKMEEETHISLKNRNNRTIERLIYDPSEQRLYVVADNLLFAAEGTTGMEKVFELDEGWQELCVYGGFILCLYHRQKEQILSIYRPEDKEIITEQIIPSEFQVKWMGFISDPAKSGCPSLRILGIKEDGNYCFMEYRLEEEFLKNHPHFTSNMALNPEDVSDIHIQQLYRNRMINPFCPNRMQRSNGCNFDCWDSGEQNSYCDCHNGPCGCDDTHCPNPGPVCPPPHEDKCCHQSRADLIESIALTEAAIAHVINAEGEKLQKAIAENSDVSMLLKVNESVLKTIIHCTQLEQMLYYKLEAILNADFCVSHSKPCPHPDPDPCCCNPNPCDNML